MLPREMRHEDCFGPAWDDLSLAAQDDVIDKVNDDHLDDEDAERYLMDSYGLSSFSAQNVMNARLLEGTTNVSMEAASILYETMLSASCLQSDAVIEMAERDDNFVNPYTRTAGEPCFLSFLIMVRLFRMDAILFRQARAERRP